MFAPSLLQLTLLCCFLLLGLPAAAAEPKAEGKENSAVEKWQPLFDGKSLQGWKSAKFGGEGEVRVDDGQIVLPMGAPMTGITYTKDFPKTNYALRVVAQRAEGGDFFAAVTFPVGDSHCSFVNGGWGGFVAGLSSIDGYDASENQTTQYFDFKSSRWYEFVIRVTPTNIQVHVDGKKIIDQDIEGRKITTRPEVDLNKPLGIASFDTQGKIKTIEYRKLEPSKPTD